MTDETTRQKGSQECHDYPWYAAGLAINYTQNPINNIYYHNSNKIIL